LSFSLNIYHIQFFEESEFLCVILLLVNRHSRNIVGDPNLAETEPHSILTHGPPLSLLHPPRVIRALFCQFGEVTDLSDFERKHIFMYNPTRVCIFRIVMLKVNRLCFAGWTKILPKPPFAYSASLFLAYACFREAGIGVFPKGEEIMKRLALDIKINKADYNLNKV